MVPAYLGFFDVLLALALVGAGLLGAHFRVLAPFTGFQLFVLGFFVAIVAVFLGAIGLLMTQSPERAVARNHAKLALAFGLAIALPVLAIVVSAARYPAINDVATDTDNPPEFVQAAKLEANRGRDLRYDKARYAAAQTRGYGDLKPLRIAAPEGEVFSRVQKVAAQMPGWEITYIDPKTAVLGGIATRGLFRFQDDFVIQVRPAGDGASLVEMRSKSRQGVGDLGANYRRIKAFFARLSAPGD